MKMMLKQMLVCHDDLMMTMMMLKLKHLGASLPYESAVHAQDDAG